MNEGLPLLVNHLLVVGATLVLNEGSFGNARGEYFALALEDQEESFGHLSLLDEILSIRICLRDKVGCDPHQVLGIDIVEIGHRLEDTHLVAEPIVSG